MSSHPNTLILAEITPTQSVEEFLELIGCEDSFEILFEGDYLEVASYENQDNGIYPAEGKIIIHDYLTYGWGETATWDEVLSKKYAFENTIKRFCEKYGCTYQLQIGANFY